jgi:hypothetical protein
MSALGQKRTSEYVRSMSALHPKADIAEPMMAVPSFSDATCAPITAQTELVIGIFATAVAALVYISPIILA